MNEIMDILKKMDWIIHKRDENIAKANEIKQKWLLTDYLLEIRMESKAKLGELFAEKGRLLDELDDLNKENQKLLDELEYLKRRIEKLKEES